MVPTVAELGVMSNKAFAAACKTAGLAHTVNKNVLQERLIAHYHPDAQARTSRSKQPGMSPRSSRQRQRETPERSSLEDLELSADTIAALEAENITEPSQLSLLTEQVVDHIVVKTGDQCRIIRLITDSAYTKGPILKVTASANHRLTVVMNGDTGGNNKLKKRRRLSRSPVRSSRSSSSGSSSGSSSSSSSSTARTRKSCPKKSSYSLAKLPLEAREMPPAHELVFSKTRLSPNGKFKRRLQLLTLVLTSFRWVA